MKHKPQSLFGAADMDRDDPYIPTWTLHMTAASVRASVGEAWDENDHLKGWRAAKKDGMRVVKCTLRMNG